jgi:hypothetical protein
MKGMILRTGDLESTAADLAEREVVMTDEIQETPWAKYTSFQDSDVTPGRSKRFEAVEQSANSTDRPA